MPRRARVACLAPRKAARAPRAAELASYNTLASKQKGNQGCAGFLTTHLHQLRYCKGHRCSRAVAATALLCGSRELQLLQSSITARSSERYQPASK